MVKSGAGECRRPAWQRQRCCSPKQLRLVSEEVGARGPLGTMSSSGGVKVRVGYRAYFHWLGIAIWPAPTFNPQKDGMQRGQGIYACSESHTRVTVTVVATARGGASYRDRVSVACAEQK